MAESEWITEDLLLPYFNRSRKGTEDLGGILPIAEMERRMIKKALKKYGVSVEGKQKAAKTLQISLATLYNKIKRYDIRL